MRAIVFIIGLLLTLPAAAMDEVELGTTILPPYQTEHDGQFGGRSVDIMNCVFDRLDYRWHGRAMPWQRARIEMETGELDGFFTGMPDSRLNQYARASVPLALEKWYWFARAEAIFQRETFPEGIRLGALRDRATLFWLRSRGIQPDTVVATPEQLIKLVSTGRIDAFLGDIRVVDQASRALNMDPDGLNRRFHQYMPLVAWFSRGFLQDEPAFLEAFDQRVHACIGDTFRISARERARLARLARDPIRSWTRNEAVLRHLRRVNDARSGLQTRDIRRLDEQWRTGDRALIDSIRNTWLSEFLRKQQASTDPLFHEIMITGQHGLNAGISRVTSDYWQGDETKFRATRDSSDGQPVIEDIHFDESTRSFLVHVSLPIRAPDTDEFLGVVTAGVDIQHALAADY